MHNKELDKMREKLFQVSREADLDTEPDEAKWEMDLVDQIFKVKTSNGYSLKEMIEFFSKIKPDTQREAVVKREAELPQMHPDTQFPESMAYKQAQQDMLDKHFVEEVVDGMA